MASLTSAAEITSLISRWSSETEPVVDPLPILTKWVSYDLVWLYICYVKHPEGDELYKSGFVASFYLRIRKIKPYFTTDRKLECLFKTVSHL